jgi:hypothetical protein
MPKQALMLIVEHDGPTMFARIGVMRGGKGIAPKPAPAPRRETARAYKIVR